MVTFDQLVAAVESEAAAEVDRPIFLQGVEVVVRVTIKRLGLCVNANTGEVYTPAPRPKTSYPEHAEDFHYPERRPRGARRRR